MITDFFCNTVYIRKRIETTVYADGIAKKQYENEDTPVSCRVSSLNYKDLQLLQGIDDVQVNVQKLYTLPDIEIKPTDYVIWKSESYQVIAQYEAQDRYGHHHNKYFIKLVK